MIEVKSLHKYYDQGSRRENHVLKGVSLALPDTGFVCILGPSGCGKTSLLNAIGGLDVFQSGSVDSVSAVSNAERSRNFGYVFQNYYLLADHSVGYNVYLGLHNVRMSHREKLKRVRQALQAVDMEPYIRRQCAELSGGQQQRVAIARAIVCNPRVILADEPTGNLDEANTRQICTLLRKISKTSLVIMVTHEERIARFFADRIITMESGSIAADESAWQRQDFLGDDGRTLYTGDFETTRWNTQGLQFRLLRQTGAEDIKLDMVVLKDRVILKTDNALSMTCTANSEQPRLVEGARPRLKLEDLDNQKLPWDGDTVVSGKPGVGIRFRDMLTEAVHLRQGGGLRRISTSLFLWILSILICLCVGDWLMLRSIDPEDFIEIHSQALEVSLERGEKVDLSVISNRDLYKEYKSYLPTDGESVVCVPQIANLAAVSGSAFAQIADLEMKLERCSYVPVEFLPEETLIRGRMPKDAYEVVVDRWVLDKVRQASGVAQNGILDNDYFLGKELNYGTGDSGPVIVGICDSGEPAIYIARELFVTLGVSGVKVASLSELQARYPGKYDHITLTKEECIVLPAVAGVFYRGMEGAHYSNTGGLRLRIQAICEEKDFYPAIIVADSLVDQLMIQMSYQSFWVFTDDKTATTAFLQDVAQRQMDGRVQVTVKDTYSQRMQEYVQASQIRSDARTIVSVTVILLCMGMLLLLRRVEVRKQLSMLSVYRLLGIPVWKTAGIFALESLLSVLTAVVPAAAISWIGIQMFGAELLLPGSVAVLICLTIGLYHLAVSLLPLYMLLRLPPAQLAAKYD